MNCLKNTFTKTIRLNIIFKAIYDAVLISGESVFILNDLFGAASRKTIPVPLHKIDFLRSLTVPPLIPVFLWADQKTKPRWSEVLSGFCGWSPQNTLCYVNAKSIRDRTRTRNSGTDFDVLSMDHLPNFVQKYCSCIQYLSILRVFAVSEGPQFTGATKSG